MDENRFPFGYEGQDLLLACMCRAPEFFAGIGPLVKPEYMWGLASTQVCGYMQDLRNEYGHYPTFDYLDLYIQRQCGREKEARYNECHDYLKKLREIDTRDAKGMAREVGHFCRYRAVLIAVRLVVQQMKDDKVPDNVVPMFEEALRVGADTSEVGVCYWDEMPDVVRELTAKNWGIRTGYQLLDEVWINGWGPGWLIVPLAPPKGMKSMFAMNLALNMCRRTARPHPVPVFYYACELSAQLTCARGYCLQAGLNMKEMHASPGRFIAQATERMNRDFDDPKGRAGQILVKGFASKTASIADIKAHALASSERFAIKPRVIVIDHAETIKPAKRVKDASDHRQQADIYTEARAMGEELGACVIMPDRCNRETVNHAVPNMTSFQGAFQKAGEVDVAIGLCQTIDESHDGEVRYFIFLNRHGKQYDYFKGRVETDRFTMRVDKALDYALEMERWEEERERKRGDRRPRRHTGNALNGLEAETGRPKEV
jgi:hypothetical protein